MLIGETPRMRDVRRRFVQHGWAVVQACGHVRGIRRRLVLESSGDLVLVVSTHSAVHRRYGRALAALLEDRSSFPALRITIVLLDEESTPGDSRSMPERFRRMATAVAVGATPSVEGGRTPADDVSAFRVPCDLRAFTPEEVVRHAVAEIDSPRPRHGLVGGMLVAGDTGMPDWPDG
jgi:hypothetical protein